MMDGMLVWFNGDVMAESEARVSVLDRGVVWGYGLFETLRAYGGRIWAFQEHYERLRAGSEALEIAIPPAEVAHGAMRTVLEANGLADAGVRLTITGGAGPADPHEEPFEAPNVAVTAWPLRDYSSLYESGVALVTLPGGGRPLAELKTTSYAVSVAGRVAARRAGADDALFVGDGDLVMEATGSNLFVVRGDALVTPPLATGVLPGVTRRTVMEVAHRTGLRPQEAVLRVSDLFDAEEVVLTSSLREVYAARSLDGRALPRASHAEALRGAYREAVSAALRG